MRYQKNHFRKVKRSSVKKRKRRRLRTVPLWKYSLVNCYLILALALNIGYIFQCFELSDEAEGKSFEHNGMNCTIHSSIRYCCDPDSVDVLETDLNTSEQVNFTYFPSCSKIQVHAIRTRQPSHIS